MLMKVPGEFGKHVVSENKWYSTKTQNQELLAYETSAVLLRLAF